MEQETKEFTLTPEQANKMRAECQYRIDLAAALVRLENNADFKKVFIDDYSEKEASRLVHLLGEKTFNYGGKKAEYREDLHERMLGVAWFNEYMRNIFSVADQAKNTLQRLDEATRG